MGTHIRNHIWLYLAILALLSAHLVEGARAEEMCYPYSADDGPVCFPEKLANEKVVHDDVEDIDEVVIVMRWHDSYEEVTAAYTRELEPKDQPLEPGEMLEAWSEQDYSEHLGLWFCTVHAIHPEYVIGDARMDALGHELYHCLVDDFHL